MQSHAFIQQILLGCLVSVYTKARHGPTPTASLNCGRIQLLSQPLIHPNNPATHLMPSNLDSTNLAVISLGNSPPAYENKSKLNMDSQPHLGVFNMALCRACGEIRMSHNLTGVEKQCNCKTALFS
ncbi:MAG: hypothetical protein M1167_08045 [Chloroflexi bacterium]|nr:hypothetical protein [Chloroflexota bacterium]MCL5949502.1 hypothetical protein [Candidatus Bathyarchaeota archaeon]